MEDQFNHHKDLCINIHNTFKQKNLAYGNSFEESVLKYGLISALTRMSDKWNRIENLVLNPSTDTGDEPLKDSLLDLANYCLMTVMVLENKERDQSAE